MELITKEYDKKNEEAILESAISIGQNIETFVQSQLKDRFRELNSEIPEDYLIEQIKEIIQSFQAESEEEIFLLKEQLGNNIGKYNK